jgi:hypothetical protein
MQGSENAQLLSTIKIPMNNVRAAVLPLPSYGKRADIVKPIGERMHVYPNGRVQPRDLADIGTPELRHITDQDLWSPIKPGAKSELRSPVKPLMEKPQPQVAAAHRQGGFPGPAAEAPVDHHASLKRRRDRTRKINFVQNPGPVQPVIENQVMYKPVFNPRRMDENEGNARAAGDPRWRQIPVAAREPVPERARPDFMDNPFADRRHPLGAINPRFRQFGIR